MDTDPRTPVLVGAGQVNIREGDAPEPVELIATAARRAADDAGVSGLLRHLDSVRVVNILSRRYPDPGALVAERVGARPRQTVSTTVGGNIPQVLVNHTAAAIARGQMDVALVGGAESWRTREAYRKRGQPSPWSRQPDDARPTETIGTELALGTPQELALGLLMPVQWYPMFENALPAKRATSRDDHLRRASELWARFSRVAADNPYAAVRQPSSAEAIRTPGPDNRMIGWPYPKLMNSNNHVDQGAALILCSAEAARRYGVPTDRWVYLHGAAEATDIPEVPRRWDLAESPAIRAAGADALQAAAIGIDDLAYVDLYSCFPSAVQVAAEELGLGLERELTVTGGLTFAGGPWNNYVTHAIAAMMGCLRADPGAYGLCTANGGHLSKHAVGVYSCRPPATALEVAHPQGIVDAAPARPLLDDPSGEARVETFTVMHDREGQPERGFVACLDAEGRRALVATEDADDLSRLVAEDLIGAGVKLSGQTLRLP